MPPRILVIEDDPVWRDRFQKVLKPLGYTIDIAENADTANACLRSTKYDLVLLDVCLEGNDFTLDSRLFLGSLRQEYPDLTVVAITGWPLSPSKIFELSQSGIVDFIYKPEIDLQDFRRRIQDSLRPKDFPSPEATSSDCRAPQTSSLSQSGAGPSQSN